MFRTSQHGAPFASTAIGAAKVRGLAVRLDAPSVALSAMTRKYRPLRDLVAQRSG